MGSLNQTNQCNSNFVDKTQFMFNNWVVNLKQV